jgi:hypothetical protein
MNRLTIAARRAMRAGGAFVSGVHVAACYGTSRGLLRITWSIATGIPRGVSGADGVNAFVIGRPADLVAKLPELSDRALDMQITEAAWRLGAWDLMRYEKQPLPAGADIRDPRYGLAIFFGLATYVLPGIGPLAEGAGATDEDMERAAREGWVDWFFKPLALATPAMRDRWRDQDATLNAACRRGPKTIPHRRFGGGGKGFECRLGRGGEK